MRPRAHGLLLLLSATCGRTELNSLSPEPPFLRLPGNGAYTGSVRAPATRRTLQPTFTWQRGGQLDAPSYELQVDDSCDPDGFGLCAFPSPEIDVVVPALAYRPERDLAVSYVPPVGRRYYWRVRGCNRGGGEPCSAWAPVRYVDVGRERGDIDGDGYADVLVAAPQLRSVFVHRGSSRGPSSSPDLVLRADASNPTVAFGIEVTTLGDVNGDGFGDVNIDGHRLYLGTGAAPLLLPGPALEGFSSTALNGSPSSAGVGDTDADGYADVLAGPPSIYQGDKDAASRVSVFPQTLPKPPETEPFGCYGCSLSGAGDVDGDGHLDVLVGAPMEKKVSSPGITDPVFMGAAYLFFGGPGSVRAQDTVRFENPIATWQCKPEEVETFEFGTVVARAGDLDRDGLSEFAISNLSAYETCGRMGAFTFFGTTFIYSREAGSGSWRPRAELRAYKGLVFPAGDFDCDGFDDLGAFTFSIGDGLRIGVYSGSSSGLVPSARWTADVTSAATGEAVFPGSGDINGDGCSDIALGNSFQGRVFIFVGGAGQAATPSYTLVGPRDSAFGKSVAM